MSDITFEEITVIKVKLEGKHVGNIKEVANGYAYFPKGSKIGGGTYPSKSEAKASLEDDYA